MEDVHLPTTPKFLTCIALALMAAVTVGATSALAQVDIPDDQPPRGPSAPIEQPGAETPK